ncbi:MAG: helix-turn-helix domain-containing protein [Streptosporangiales bacterium]|nr:helix-turn-helix domain-containing protein [Streptosporangiales bacterium]
MMNAEGLWTPDDLSSYLDIPKETLYRWRYLGIGPVAVRIGKHLRYDPADVRAWLDEQKRAVA